MKYGIYTYEERLKDTFLPLIDFEYLHFNPECVQLVWEKYLTDYSFKSAVNQKMYLDSIFSERFNKVFSRYLNNEKSR